MGVSEIARAFLMPCSSQAEWSPVPSAPVSPTSPNNDLISIKDQLTMPLTKNRAAYKAEIEAYRMLIVAHEGDEASLI